MGGGGRTRAADVNDVFATYALNGPIVTRVRVRTDTRDPRMKKGRKKKKTYDIPNESRVIYRKFRAGAVCARVRTA